MIIGQEPDYEKLRKTIAYHNQALEYQAEINELKTDFLEKKLNLF